MTDPAPGAAAVAPGTDPAAPAAGTDPAAPAGQQPGGDTQQQAADAQAQGQGQQQPQAVDMTGWPQAAIDAYNRRDQQAKDYQREAGDSRIKSKANAAAEERRNILAELAKVLDPQAAADAEPTVQSVTEALTATQAERDTTRREAAAVAEAWKLGVDPAKLGYLQYQLSRSGEFGSLDVSAQDFQGKVSAAVAAQIAADPTLKAAGSVQQTGAETHGGANGSAQITAEQWEKMSIADRSKLFVNDRAEYNRLSGRDS